MGGKSRKFLSPKIMREWNYFARRYSRFSDLLTKQFLLVAIYSLVYATWQCHIDVEYSTMIIRQRLIRSSCIISGLRYGQVEPPLKHIPS